METEKVYQEKIARTIQQKQDGSGALQFVDNRPVNQLLQRVSEEDEDALQGKFETPVQRVGEEDEDDTLQGKFEGALQRVEEDEDEALQMKADTIVQQKANNTGIPNEVKQKMEDSFGTDFSDVRIHPESSQAPEVGALAYTQGTDIHFAPGQFKPDTSAGQQLIGHELAHVIQQAEGRVQPTTEISGMPVNDNEGLEHEADVLGAQAAR